ncbi:MAG: hypothetical protein HY867_15315 [Chloroflexi bacterium]|nr:hypothetical protein [Chloroflexota bacterium]
MDETQSERAMNIFILFAIVMWLGGFFSMKGLISLDKNSIFEMRQVVVPPTWLFYLCGAPKSGEFRPGSMTIGALRAQIAGVCMAIFSIALSIWKPTLELTVVGLGFCFLVPYFISLWVSKNRGLSVNRKKK